MNNAIEIKKILSEIKANKFMQVDQIEEEKYDELEDSDP